MKGRGGREGGREGGKVDTLMAKYNAPHSFASADQKYFATSSFDRTFKLWETEQ